MTTQNFAYYRQRAEEELAAAEQTDDPGIAEIHREMARRYRNLVGDDPNEMSRRGRLPQPAPPSPVLETSVG